MNLCPREPRGPLPRHHGSRLTVCSLRQRLARGRDNWSLGELLQALTVLAHYHALCSFVLGCRALDAGQGDVDTETDGESADLSRRGLPVLSV